MNIDEFKLNFRDAYKVGKDEGELKRHEELLSKEFGDYPGDKLSKAWKAIRRHHKATWYPSIGQILEAMEKGDVKEYVAIENKDLFWNRCEKCRCNFSLKSRMCPDCNRPLSEGDFVINDIIIVKGDRYLPNHVTCQDNCSMCKKFKDNRNIRGAKCRGWGKDEHERSVFNCFDCPCKSCCHEVGVHDEEHVIGSIMEYVKGRKFIDPYWIEYYQKLEIRIGTILSYCGRKYENKTGAYAGHSPKTDTINWKNYVPPKSWEKVEIF